MISTFGIRNSPDNCNENYGTYEILCHNCNEMYLGETGRLLEQIIKKHKKDVHNGSTNNVILGKGHSFDWNSARLIYKCSDFYKRRMIESTMIGSFCNMNIFNKIILSNIDYKC